MPTHIVNRYIIFSLIKILLSNLTVMSGYFNLEKSFAFYGSYHANPINQVIHVICVPLIFTTSIEILSRFLNHMAIKVILAFYICSFIKMHAKAGLMYAPVLFGMYYIGTSSIDPTVSTIFFCVSWIAQFIGHGVFEKRAPALLTNLPQGLHAAVFFVWLELIFFFGFDPELRHRLQLLVDKARRS